MSANSTGWQAEVKRRSKESIFSVSSYVRVVGVKSNLD